MVLLVEEGHWPSCAKQTNQVNDHLKNHSETVKELQFISETSWIFIVLEVHHSDKWMHGQNNHPGNILPTFCKFYKSNKQTQTS